MSERDRAAHLTELRSLAKKATPGPWSTTEPGVGGPRLYVSQDPVAYPKYAGTPVCATSRGGFNKHAADDAAFIAAADPTVVLAVLTCFQRAVFLAEYLFAMVPRQAWIYKGDYRAERLAEELKQMAGLFTAPEAPSDSDAPGASSPPGTAPESAGNSPGARDREETP